MLSLRNDFLRVPNLYYTPLHKSLYFGKAFFVKEFFFYNLEHYMLYSRLFN